MTTYLIEVHPVSPPITIAVGTPVVATEGEALAGVDNTKMMTPLRTQQQVAALSGAVISVNAQTGAVILTPDDLDDSGTAHQFATAAELAKLSGIEAGANLYTLPAATPTTLGGVELATDGESAPGLAVQGNDSRLADARTPTAHTHPISDTTGLQAALDAKETPAGAQTKADAAQTAAEATAAGALSAHTGDTANPHSVTKSQVGLGNVPNTDATARSNHTGTQLASTVSDFSTSALAAVTWTTITGKPGTFPPDGHTHAAIENGGSNATVNDYGSEGSITLTAAGANGYIDLVVNGGAVAYFADNYSIFNKSATFDSDVQFDGVAYLTHVAECYEDPTSGDHLTRKSWIDTQLSAKAATSHAHDAADVNAGTLDGDRLPGLSASKRGGVPATGTPSGKYLKDDGTWAAIGGGGDMLGANNLSDVANAATSFTNIKQAATSTSTGVVELATDGESAANLAVQANDSRLSNARTPTAHTHATTDITSGVLDPDRLASGSALQVFRRNAANTAIECATIAVGGGDTDLGYTASTRVLTSSTGDDVTLPLADGTNPGLMASADFTKLAGVASGATANAGTVTSVEATVPTGLTISGSPVTTSGTLAIGLDTDRVIPTQATLDAKLARSSSPILFSTDSETLGWPAQKVFTTVGEVRQPVFDVGEFVRIEVASGAHAAKWMSGRISAKSGQDVTIEVLHGGQATDAGSSPGDWIITSLGPLLTVRYAFSDNATLITTGVKGYFMDDWATKSILVGAVVYLHYEAAAGSTFIADINLTGTGTLLGTNKVQVDTTEKSSVDAATQPTYNLTVADSPTLLTYGNELQIEVDQAGTGAKGGIAYLKFGRLE